MLQGEQAPLMVRKSDGGYGYGTTDMAAITHRIRTERADWVIYVADEGQAGHFKLVRRAPAQQIHVLRPQAVPHGRAPAGAQVPTKHPTPACGFGASTLDLQVFAAARKAGILPADAAALPRVSHVGFGLVLGEDGKRFRTRASEVGAAAATPAHTPASCPRWRVVV
jgi:arginyl-tRNA synthetase